MLVVDAGFGWAFSGSLGSKAKMEECNSLISKGLRMTYQYETTHDTRQIVKRGNRIGLERTTRT